MRILFVSHTRKPVNGWGRYTGDFTDALRAAGHETVVLSEWLEARRMPNLRDPYDYLSGFSWLRDARLLGVAIREWKPDVIHVVVEPYTLLLPFVPLRGIRVFATFHGTYAYLPALVGTLRKPLYRFLTARALARVSAVAAVSAHTKARYLALSAHDAAGFPEERIEVIPTGIDLTRFSGARHRDASRPFTLITVGALKSRKGFIEIVRALGTYKKMYTRPFRYEIVGTDDESGSYVRALHDAIEEEGIGEEVVFRGKISSEELEEAYASADAFIMLPIDGTRFEGFGVVYIEANAYGVPTVGAKGTAAAEAVADGVSGLLGDAKDPEEIARLIERVAGGEIRPDDAKAHAAKYEIGKIAGRLAGLYERHAPRSR